MPLAHFSRIGGYGNQTPDLLHGRPEYVPLHHQPINLISETDWVVINGNPISVIWLWGTPLRQLIGFSLDKMCKICQGQSDPFPLPDGAVWSPYLTCFPDISAIWEVTKSFLSGSLGYDIPNMMWYEVMVALGTQKTEIYMNYKWIDFYFILVRFSKTYQQE